MIEVDHDRKTVTLDGTIHYPSRAEFEILACLTEHPGWLMSREQLLDRYDNTRGERDPRTVDSHIKRLRKRGFHQIRTRYSFGYYWEA